MIPLPDDLMQLDECYPGMALADQLRAYADAVRAEERERAARICDGFASIEGIAQRCAQAIRDADLSGRTRSA